MSGARVSWPPERVEELRRLYVALLLPPGSIARRLGLPVRAVRRKIAVLRLGGERGAGALDAQRLAALDLANAARARARARRGQVVWGPAQLSRLERRYLADNAAPAVIAAELGFPVLAVRRKAKALGLPARRKALGGKRARVARLDAGGGAGVTRVAPSIAVGVTGWETALKAAPPPQADRADSAALGRARARRAAELRRTAVGPKTPPPSTGPVRVASA